MVLLSLVPRLGRPYFSLFDFAPKERHETGSGRDVLANLLGVLVVKTLCVLVVETEAGNGQVWYLDLRSC